MLKELLNNISNKYDSIKKETEELNSLINTTSTLTNLFPIPKLNNDPSEHKITFIKETCPDINEDKAKLITSLIPVNETLLDAYYSKEIKTNTEYYLIPTNKYLWIINQKNYAAYPYTNLKTNIIKNNLMSKIIILNNILFVINGNNTKINTFINIINNKEERELIIKEKTAYLCDIIPIYQKINSISSGISIDNNNNVVFHTKNKSYKYNINEIDNYEILLDNQIYSSKKYNSSNKIGSFQISCYGISLRITTKSNEMIIIPILESNSLGTKYTNHNTTFQKNLNFATTITNKLTEISPKS